MGKKAKKTFLLLAIFLSSDKNIANNNQTLSIFAKNEHENTISENKESIKYHVYGIDAVDFYRLKDSCLFEALNMSLWTTDVGRSSKNYSELLFITTNDIKNETRFGSDFNKSFIYLGDIEPSMFLIFESLGEGAFVLYATKTPNKKDIIAIPIFKSNSKLYLINDKEYNGKSLVSSENFKDVIMGVDPNKEAIGLFARDLAINMYFYSAEYDIIVQDLINEILNNDNTDETKKFLDIYETIVNSRVSTDMILVKNIDL